MIKEIFRFELKQLFRDKKTIFFIFILPLLLMPVVSGGLTFFAGSQLKSIAAEKVSVLVEDDLLLQGLEPAFTSRKIKPVYRSVISDDKDSVKQLLNEHCAVVTISRPDSAVVPLITVRYVSAKDKQGLHAKRVLGALHSVKEQLTTLRYREVGIADYWQSSEVDQKNLAPKIQTERSQYAKMLPNSLIFVLLFGVFMLANYLILGEKDNKTLETLLSTGVRRQDIIKGKFSLIISGGLIMSVLEFISFYLYGRFATLADYTIHFTLPQAARFVTISLFIAVFFAALAININCRLKSTSSGSIVILPLNIIIAVLIFAGSMDGIAIDRGLLLVPVLSFAGILKEVVMDTHSLGRIGIMLGATAAYSAVLFAGAARVLSREDILERDTEDIDLLTANDKLGFALLSFAVLVMFYFQAGGYLQSLDLLWGLAVSLVVIIGGASLLLLKLGKEPLLSSYRFKPFKLKYLLLALFLGLFAKFPILHLNVVTGWLFPLPELGSLGEMLEKQFAGVHLGVIILVAAVLPGIFEELLFRGTYLKLVERGRGKWKTALIVGALFGAMHLDLARLVETGLLGVVLTYLTIESGSIFPAMILHTLNNASSLAMMEFGKDAALVSRLEQWQKVYHLDILLTIVTLAVLLWWLLPRKRRAGN